MNEERSLDNTQILKILSDTKMVLVDELHKEYITQRVSIPQSVIDRVELLEELEGKFNDAISLQNIQNKW
tara:strand:- start:400 stop:609 length:210 start_codon:yes stop_codon:yes gene_type:complete